MIPYANLRDLRFELREGETGVPQPTVVTNQDVQMMDFLRYATRRIDAMLRLPFIPYYATKTYGDGTGWSISTVARRLGLPEPALSISAVTDGNGAALADSLYTTPGSPITDLTLTDCCVSWYTTLGCQISGASVTALWGYHSDYANAWIDTLDTVRDNPLSAGAKLITVQQATGADELGRTPRFAAGQLLRIGSEFVEVLRVSGNTLGVRRGVNGTTAAEHLQGAAIDVFEVEPDIRQAALRWAAYPFKRRGDYTTSTFDGVQATNFPKDAPPEVYGILQGYANGVL